MKYGFTLPGRGPLATPESLGAIARVPGSGIVRDVLDAGTPVQDSVVSAILNTTTCTLSAEGVVIVS